MYSSIQRRGPYVYDVVSAIANTENRPAFFSKHFSSSAYFRIVLMSSLFFFSPSSSSSSSLFVYIGISENKKAQHIYNLFINVRRPRPTYKPKIFKIFLQFFPLNSEFINRVSVLYALSYPNNVVDSTRCHKFDIKTHNIVRWP